MIGLFTSFVTALASSVLAVMDVQNGNRGPKFIAGLSTLLVALCSAGYCASALFGKECSNKKSLEETNKQQFELGKKLAPLR